MVKEHWAQTSRASQLDKVEDIIGRKLGGWNKITAKKNERAVLWLIARELNCTYEKAKEYVDIVVQSSLAKVRLGWKDVTSAETSQR